MPSNFEIIRTVLDMLCTKSGLTNGPEFASAAIKRFKKLGPDTDPGDVGTVIGCKLMHFFPSPGYTSDIQEWILKTINDTYSIVLTDVFAAAKDIQFISGTIENALASLEDNS